MLRMFVPSSATAAADNRLSNSLALYHTLSISCSLGYAFPFLPFHCVFIFHVAPMKHTHTHTQHKEHFSNLPVPNKRDNGRLLAATFFLVSVLCPYTQQHHTLVLMCVRVFFFIFVEKTYTCYVLCDSHHMHRLRFSSSFFISWQSAFVYSLVALLTRSPNQTPIWLSFTITLFLSFTLCAAFR